MEISQPVDWLNKSFEGYVVNAEFSAANKKKIMEYIAELSAQLGKSVFIMPEDSLHITLLDWVAPLVDYGQKNKTHLFEEIRPAYDSAMNKVIGQEKAITVDFDKIEVSPSTIFVRGIDNGEFQRVRDTFISSITPLPNTKKPPQIIHSSLARFTEPVELSQVREIISRISVNITQIVNEFRLIHTTKEPMLEYEVIKTYRTA